MAFFFAHFSKGDNTPKKTKIVKPEDEFQQCPSCSRKFGPKAYDRHVKWCMEKARRISNSPKKDLEALAKLQTRISYRYVNDVDEKNPISRRPSHVGVEFFPL